MIASTFELTPVQEETLQLFAAFSALGLDENDAARLALHGASPSQARILLEHRCPAKLVAEILA